MNIGDAASRSGVSAKMIRYYESIGLIPPARRTAAGYRDYGADDVDVLRFLRRLRELGFSARQMAEMLVLWQDRERCSADVKRIALRHIEVLEEKARSLQAMSRTLRELADHCQGDDRPQCPILDTLGGAQRPLPEPGAAVRQC